MPAPASRVLIVDDGQFGDDVSASVRAYLDDVALEVVSPASVTPVLEGDTDGRVVGCVVYRPTTVDDLSPFLSRVRSSAPDAPVLVITSESVPPTPALEAGAADVVDGTLDAVALSRLLATRIERILTTRGPTPLDGRDSSASRASAGADLLPVLRATVDENELVCLFDADGRHTVAVGRRFDDVVAPDALESARVTEAFAELPSVAAHLDANYAAARQGERRSREFAIGDRTVRVDTVPIPWPSAPGSDAAGERPVGLARFRPGAAVGATDRTDGQSKLHRLHEIASELETKTAEEDIFALAVDCADRVLEFDACAILELADGVLVPRAATAPELDVAPEPKGPEDGIAGRTIRTGEAALIEDLRADVDAEPTSDRFRSALSIPVGEDCVFQAVSTTVGRYDERDRKLAELLLAHVSNALDRVRYQEALGRERDHFAALFQNVPDAAVRYRIADGEPNIESVNSAFVRLFGYEPTEAVGETTGDLLVPDDRAEEARALYDDIAAGERADREVRRRTTDGVCSFLLRSVPVAADERIGYLIYTDLSELKRRERELTEKTERLDRFASVVSHDLRNPLSVAAAYTEQARETGDCSYLEEVERNHDRAFAIIEDVLTLAREGGTVTDPETVSIDLLAREAWESVETDDAALAVETDATLAADRSRFRQVLENVFRNAVEHGSTSPRSDAHENAAEHGGDGLTITVGTTDDGFFVADDGVGIPSEERESIFEHGYTTSDGGTGFGLSIVAEIAADHGWTTAVTESVSGGARIEFGDVPSMEG